jgi:hypothetical protein
LIKELETEKTELLRLIDEAVKEQEFLTAHFHFEALGQVNRQLQTLKNLDDELYDKKHSLARGIENLRKRLNEETVDRLRSAITRFIDEKENELRELNQIPKRQKNVNGTHHLRDCLEQFVSEKIRGVRIVIIKSDNLAVEIRRTKGGARFTMHNIHKLHTNYMLSEERFLKLKGLGFTLNNKGDKATKILTESKNEMADKLMRLISIIVFEVFYFKELDAGAEIEILAKNPGLEDKS